MSKLTHEEIADIRRLKLIGLTMRSIADTYHVSVPCIKYHTMGMIPLPPAEVLSLVKEAVTC